MRLESGFRVPDCSKSTIIRKNEDEVIICQYFIVNFFDVVLFLLSTLVTGPSFMSKSLLVMTIFDFKGFYQKSENRKNRNIPV